MVSLRKKESCKIMNSQKPIDNSKLKKAKNPSKKSSAKSIITLFLIFIFGTTVMCLVLFSAMSNHEKEQPSKGNTYLFYEPDYDLNILNDENYLQLDRTVKFSNPDNGITYAIVDGNMDEVPTVMHEYVALLCDFVDYAINGESEKLNQLFSKEYIAAGGKTKMDFTMQQLYNIKITYVTSSSEIVDGSTVESYDYWLEYMIRKNNGTFRNDMESDCIRKEYVRVTNRNGVLGIDVLAPYNTEVKEPGTSEGNRILISFAASAAIVGVACLAGGLLIKKKR